MPARTTTGIAPQVFEADPSVVASYEENELSWPEQDVVATYVGSDDIEAASSRHNHAAPAPVSLRAEKAFAAYVALSLIILAFGFGATEIKERSYTISEQEKQIVDLQHQVRSLSTELDRLKYPGPEPVAKDPYLKPAPPTNILEEPPLVDEPSPAPIPDEVIEVYIEPEPIPAPPSEFEVEEPPFPDFYDD